MGPLINDSTVTGLRLCFCAQNGAGDFIGGMKFCPTDLSKVYVASGEGTLTLQSFEGRTPTVLSTTQDCGHDHHNVWWEDCEADWCSATPDPVCSSIKLLHIYTNRCFYAIRKRILKIYYFKIIFTCFLPVSGTAVWTCLWAGRCWWQETTWGSSYYSVWTERRSAMLLWFACNQTHCLLTSNEKQAFLCILTDLFSLPQIFSDKLHKAKVSHAEFNTRCDWLLATASIDHTVKLWDLRNIKDKKSFLHELPHEKAVNSGNTLRKTRSHLSHQVAFSVCSVSPLYLLCHSLLQPAGLLQTAHHRPVRPDPGVLVLWLVQASAHYPASTQTVSASHTHQGVCFFFSILPELLSKLSSNGLGLVVLRLFCSHISKQIGPRRGTHPLFWIGSNWSRCESTLGLYRLKLWAICLWVEDCQWRRFLAEIFTLFNIHLIKCAPTYNKTSEPQFQQSSRSDCWNCVQ